MCFYRKAFVFKLVSNQLNILVVFNLSFTKELLIWKKSSFLGEMTHQGWTNVISGLDRKIFFTEPGFSHLAYMESH